MTLNYVIERCEAMPAECIEIYERNVIDFRDIVPVFTVKKGGDIRQQLTSSFGKHFQGTFTAVIRPTQGGQRSTGERITFQHTLNDTHGATDSNVVHVMPNNHSVDPDKIRKELKEQFDRDMQLKLMEYKILELEQKRAIDGTMDNRLTNVLEKLLVRTKWFQETSSAPNTVIQGTGPSVGGQFDISVLDDAQVEQLEDAVEIIFSHMGFDAILKFSKKLDADPTLAASLNTFL